MFIKIIKKPVYIIKYLLDVDALLAPFMQKVTDENQVQVWQCIQCGKTSRYITNMKDHVEGLTYPCPECHKISKSRAGLRVHMKTVHNLSSKHCKQRGNKYLSQYYFDV